MISLETIKAGVLDILEWNHQWTDPYCPWCNAESYPVNKNGNQIHYDEDIEPEEYHTDHDEKCAVTMIESIFDNTYKWFNKPNNQH